MVYLAYFWSVGQYSEMTCTSYIIMSRIMGIDKIHENFGALVTTTIYTRIYLSATSYTALACTDYLSKVKKYGIVFEHK